MQNFKAATFAKLMWENVKEKRIFSVLNLGNLISTIRPKFLSISLTYLESNVFIRNLDVRAKKLSKLKHLS